MIQSMTGFGRASGQFENKKFIVEIKSLNSKQTDLIIRMPSLYKEKEMKLRSLLYDQLQRGKIEYNLYVENNGAETNYSINTGLALQYHQQLLELSQQMGSETKDYLSTILKLPEVVQSGREELKDTEWGSIEQLSLEAALKLAEFRQSEGDKLRVDFEERIVAILNHFRTVEEHEGDRIESVKQRIQKSLSDVVPEDRIDTNRQEQELIYYLEKLDITEEKVRLKAHCDYFMETLHSEKSQGKKLGFITQEMGREINTIGSKAYHADIQRAVVQMKDELEKIKEQVLNVL